MTTGRLTIVRLSQENSPSSFSIVFGRTPAWRLLLLFEGFRVGEVENFTADAVDNLTCAFVDLEVIDGEPATPK
jgi:hypothetical protein